MSKTIKLWIATGNKGKAKEFKLLVNQIRSQEWTQSHKINKLPGTKFQLYFLADILTDRPEYKSPTNILTDRPEYKSPTNTLKKQAEYKPPLETGKTFEENARIKALAFKNLKPKEWVLGEDSGLTVRALNNAPGIYSARYAGPKATDIENLELLLKNIKNCANKDRSASFVSHIVALSPSGKEYSAEGKVEGHIARTPTGQAGFGYDPVFIPKGETKSFAELGLEYKNRCSHRFQAIRNIMLKTHTFTVQ